MVCTNTQYGVHVRHQYSVWLSWSAPILSMAYMVCSNTQYCAHMVVTNSRMTYMVCSLHQYSVWRTWSAPILSMAYMVCTLHLYSVQRVSYLCMVCFNSPYDVHGLHQFSVWRSRSAPILSIKCKSYVQGVHSAPIFPYKDRFWFPFLVEPIWAYFHLSQSKAKKYYSEIYWPSLVIYNLIKALRPHHLNACSTFSYVFNSVHFWGSIWFWSYVSKVLTKRCSRRDNDLTATLDASTFNNRPW